MSLHWQFCSNTIVYRKPMYIKFGLVWNHVIDVHAMNEVSAHS